MSDNSLGQFGCRPSELEESCLLVVVTGYRTIKEVQEIFNIGTKQ
jgi:hypothetical protein